MIKTFETFDTDVWLNGYSNNDVLHINSNVKLFPTVQHNIDHNIISLTVISAFSQF